MSDLQDMEKEMNLCADEGGVFHLDTDDEISSKEEETSPEFLALKAEIEKKDQEAQKREEKYRYLLADFENYKKRAQKEQIEQFKFANEKILKEALVVLDYLDRAVSHAKKIDGSEKVIEGLDLVLKQFLSFLNRFGVTPIESLNKSFDPACHQAVGQVERDDLPEGEVVEDVQRGFMLYDRLIRPSFVLIAKKVAT
mgnify:CR=1 FL=1